MENNNFLLEVNDLKLRFIMTEGNLQVVDGFNFKIKRNKTLGLAGETGCGKSVSAAAILRVNPPPRILEGEILFHQNIENKKKTINLVKLDDQGKEIRRIRGNEISMIVQEPMLAFSPLHTIGNQIIEAICLHRTPDKKEAREIAIDMLDRVGFPNPARKIDAYPWQLSGGLCQRAMIAMALVAHPILLLADEPTTGLDVTIQAQILDLMKELQAKFGMSILFITHDLGVMAEMAEDLVIMYLGEDIEYGSAEDIFHRPKHPYTVNLLKSLPKLGSKKRLGFIKGIPPLPWVGSLPPGCRFRPRCPEAIKGICDKERPPAIEVEEEHKVRCFLYA